MRHLLSSRLLLCSSLALGAAVSGCQLLTKPTADTASATSAAAAPPSITIVQGNGQKGQAGRELPVMIVLRATDAAGAAVRKGAATLVVASGGGSVTPSSAATDSTGELRVRWTLGTAGAPQTLQASVGATTITVGATALFPTELQVVQGGAQTGKIATVLKNDVVVRVVGANNLPMVGMTVTFRVTAGGGGLTPTTVVTNASGEASTKWTLGAVAGNNTLTATSGDLPAVTLGAVATP